MRRFALGLGLIALSLAACGGQHPRSPLAQAAARNDVGAIRQLLDSGHKPDEPPG